MDFFLNALAYALVRLVLPRTTSHKEWRMSYESTCLSKGLHVSKATVHGQAYLVRIGVRLQKEALQFTDERGKLEGELLNGIDVVKCNSWEVRTLPEYCCCVYNPRLFYWCLLCEFCGRSFQWYGLLKLPESGSLQGTCTANMAKALKTSILLAKCRCKCNSTTISREI